jgi:uncharacterized protein (TIGR02145 family)
MNELRIQNMKSIYIILIILSAFIFSKCSFENNNILVEGCTDTDAKECAGKWMKTNLDVDHYRNGDTIRECITASEWLDAGIKGEGAWCYYENDSAIGKIYAKLYNWYAVNDSRGLAPAGWHIPSNEEWIELENCLGGSIIAGGKLKASGTIDSGNGLWQSPNQGASNESGFSALPGGWRDFNGIFDNFGSIGAFWSSTQWNSTSAWHSDLSYTGAEISRHAGIKPAGFSVRCVKDK